MAPRFAARAGVLRWRVYGRHLVIAVQLGLAAMAGAGAVTAREVAERGSDVAPADAAAAKLFKGDALQAIADYTQALNEPTLSNDRRATILNDRGVAYHRSGQAKLALDDFNRAAELLPEFAAIYNNRASVLLELGLVSEAMKDLDRAIVLAPGYAAAYNNRAIASVRLGRLGDAVEDYTSAIRLMPQAPTPMSGRGRTYLALNRPHAAVRDFTRAVATDTRFAQGYRNRAEAKLALQSYDEAIEDLSRAVAFDVSNPEIYVLRGEAYLSRRNVQAAIADFSQAITLDPKQVSAYEGRGLAHAFLQSWDEAFADLNRAIELDPRSAVAFAYRAHVYKETGQAGVGARDIETALKLNERRAEVLWAKGEIEEAQGQTEQAITDYRVAVELRPGYFNALDGLQRLGAPIDDGAGTVIAELGLEPWRVVKRGQGYVAESDLYPRLSVPLETLGEGEPKLLEWEEKQNPDIGVGLLRFSGGVLTTRSGAEETELIALVDLYEQRVMAIVPCRQGKRVAAWTWESDKVTVAGIDGVTDEFDLRQVGALAGAKGTGGRRRYGDANGPYGSSGSVWAPWEDGLGGPLASGRSASRSQKWGKKKKPKTLFDLLFN